MNVQEATTRRLPDLKGRYLPENCRETINTILKETYGYEQFRNLEIYDDLSKGKEKLCISQGQLIGKHSINSPFHSKNVILLL